MRRREVIAGAASFAVVSAAGAQQSSTVQRLAILSPSQPVAQMQENSSNPYYAAIFAELRRLGHVEGKNLAVQRYGTEQNTVGLDALAAEVVHGDPDVVLSIGSGSLQMKAATTTIPLIIWDYDPLGRGLTKSLARPGGNITGVAGDLDPSIWGKRVQLLREVFPAMAKLAFLGPRAGWDGSLSSAVRSACEALHLSLVTALYDLPAGEPGYRNAIADAVRAGADAIMVTSNPDAFENRVLITDLIGQARRPAVYAEHEFAEAGGLMAYGADFLELSQRVADDIDTILRGTKPGDIPFFGGQRFKLWINLKTARALGLTVPQGLLAGADEVIE
jgi:putative ABC transport system substrate-binding protein